MEFSNFADWPRVKRDTAETMQTLRMYRTPKHARERFLFSVRRDFIVRIQEGKPVPQDVMRLLIVEHAADALLPHLDSDARRIEAYEILSSAINRPF